MSGSTTPYPIGEVKSLEEALSKIQQYFDEMYQERLGGALVGDVFQVGDDEILSLKISPAGGLEKTSSQLSIKPDPTGAISLSANGLSVKTKPIGGLNHDIDGLYMSVTAKGDLIIGTADKVVAVLPITGVPDGYVLSKGGAGTTGLQWSPTLGVIGGTKNPPIDADKVIYQDSTAADGLVTSTWAQVKAFLKTYFDTLYATVTGRYRYSAAFADTTTITLPTISANYPAHGFILCAHASTGVISESAEFEYGSTGTVQIIRGTANIEANGATAGKISIGAAVSANPVVIKNNLGGGVSKNVLVTVDYN